MERKEGRIKAGCVKIYWVALIILLSAVPCLAVDVGNGETLNLSTAITADWLRVYGGGTANLLPGAHVDGGIIAFGGSTVNIYAGTIGPGQSVTVNNLSTVTVYGTGFADDFGLITTTEWIPGEYNTLTGTYENEDPISLQFWGFAAVYLVDTGGPGPEPITVQIDIKPGCDPNPINPGSNGVIPVAILTTDSFDASTVDPGTVTLAGADVAVRGKSDKSMARLEDVDGDGDDDLMLQVDTESMAELGDGGEVTLDGQTYEGQAIQGTDLVVIAPPE